MVLYSLFPKNQLKIDQKTCSLLSFQKSMYFESVEPRTKITPTTKRKKKVNSRRKVYILNGYKRNTGILLCPIQKYFYFIL